MSGEAPSDGQANQATVKSDSDNGQPDTAKQDLWLCRCEMWIIISLTACLVVVALHLLLWIGFCLGDEMHGRFVETVSMINDKWKVFLLVLVPLFFRPVRKFLINLREAFGAKSGKALQSIPEAGEQKDLTAKK